MEILLTLFTPTYNRAHTLPKLFESLKNQSVTNFEWLVVDDGSTDDTELLINKFKKESPFLINYVKQENQGKHIAINTGVGKAKGIFFLIIDSDDYLRPNAMDTIYLLIKKIENKKNIAGFTFIRFQENINFDSEKYGKKEWFQDEDYQWEHHGEMQFCYRTKILEQFPFPKFNGEKFCPESLIHHRIGNRYKVLYTDNVLASGQYLEGGLTSNYSLLIEKNPRTAMLFYSEKIKSKSFDRKTKEYYATTYWNIALKTKSISWLKKFFQIPFSLSFWFWKNRLLK